MKVNTVSLLIEVGKIIRCRMEKELPFSFTQSETLRFLEQEKNPTMRSVARHFKITAPSATAIVNELVAAQLVARVANAKDRREVRLQLTPLGKKVLLSVMAKRQRVVASVLAVISERDKKALQVILQNILTAIESTEPRRR